MDKKSRWLILIVVFLIGLSVVLSFYEHMVVKNYRVIDTLKDGAAPT